MLCRGIGNIGILYVYVWLNLFFFWLKLKCVEMIFLVENCSLGKCKGLLVKKNRGFNL